MTAQTTTASATTAARPAADLLRVALQADAAITALNAVAYLAGFWLLDGWLGIPGGVLAAIGAFLLAFAAFVSRVAAQPEIAHGAARTVIAVNVLWVAASVIALAAGAWSPTTGGEIVIAVQAAGVAGLAALQTVGLRRA
jgi:hypothetical protein